MTPRSFCFIIAAAVGVCIPAVASEWFVVGVDEPNEVILFVNKDTARSTSDGVVQVRVGEVNPDEKRAYDTVVFRYEFNCRSMRMRMLGSAVYKEGRLTKSDVNVMEWSDVFPHTYADSIRLTACGRTEMFFGVKREFTDVKEMTLEGRVMLRSYFANSPTKALSEK